MKIQIALFYFSLIGLFFGVINNLTVLLFQRDLLQFSSFGLIFTVGLFLVIISVFLVLKEERAFEYEKISFSVVVKSFKDAPDWLLIAVFLGLVYFMVNLLISATYEGEPEIIQGKYALTYRTEILRFLTAKEYYLYSILHASLISSILIFVYGISAAFFYPYSKNTNKSH